MTSLIVEPAAPVAARAADGLGEGIVLAAFGLVLLIAAPTPNTPRARRAGQRSRSVCLSAHHVAASSGNYDRRPSRSPALFALASVRGRSGGDSVAADVNSSAEP